MAYDSKYKRVIAEDRNAYYCPMNIAGGSQRPGMDQLDDCVEADVVGRYAGHLDIEHGE